MATNDPPPVSSPTPSPAATLRWIGGVDGHLEFTPAAGDPLPLVSEVGVCRLLQNPSTTDRNALAALASFAMFFIARAVPPTSQSALLIDALHAGASAIRSANPAASVQGAVDDMLNVATQHRGVGVRQLHLRLLHEAAATLPPRS